MRGNFMTFALVAITGLLLLSGVTGCGGSADIPYKGLMDDDPRMRADAARRLGDAMARDAVEPLIEILDDPSEEVRVTAIESLGKIGDPRAIPALSEMTGDALHTVRLGVAQALGRIGDDRGIDALTVLLHDTDDTIRLVATKSLGDMTGERSLQVLLDTALRDESETVRQHVIKVLGRRGSRDALPIVEEALLSESDIVRANAATVLGKIGNEGSIPVLIEALGDPFYKVRSLSAHSLASLHVDNPVIRQGLLDRLKIEDNGMARVDIAWSLAICGDRSQIGAIREQLATGEPEDVRAEAARALGEIGDDGDIPFLEKALTDKKGLVKMEAYKALTKLKEA